MKHLLLSIILILTLSHAQAQLFTDSYIKKLNNSQFTIYHDTKAHFSVNSTPANRLVKQGKGASEKLLKALNDKDKVIMVHYVLCQIYFNHVSFAGPKESTKEEHTVYKYYLGEEKGSGLIISETKKNGNYNMYVEEEDIRIIHDYWKEKTGKK